MSLFVRMERNKNIALILLSLVVVILILCPLMEHFSCEEPNQGIAMFFLEKMMGYERKKVCSSVHGILLSMVKNIFLALCGLVVGYVAGKPVAENKTDTSQRIHSCISLNVGRWDASDEFLEMDVHESQIVKRDIF